MTKDDYTELAIRSLESGGVIPTLTAIMEEANRIAVSVGKAYVYPEYEIQFTKFMESAKLTQHERNLLVIQQDFCTAYKCLHVSAAMGEELNPYYEHLVRSVYEALVDELQSHLLTEGLPDRILRRYIIGGLTYKME